MNADDNRQFTSNISIQGLERDILNYLSPEIRDAVKSIDMKYLNSLEEIRLRAGKPLMIKISQGDRFISRNGKLLTRPSESFIISQQEILKTLELMCENSVYAYQEEIKNGFITLKGGHRVGIAGRVVLNGDEIKHIKDISGLNIRMSRQVLGCALKIIKYLISGKGSIYNTLIISPPQCGKTTILRDIARILSDGAEMANISGMKVGIVDERSEIAACYKGVPQNEVGLRTDILDGCPKQIGMTIMLRSMSPEVIITDEIGNQGDYEAVMQVVNAGIKLITTAHGYNISEMKSRQEVIGLMEGKVFDRYVVLDNSKGPGTINEIIDGSGMEVLYSDAS